MKPPQTTNEKTDYGYEMTMKLRFETEKNHIGRLRYHFGVFFLKMGMWLLGCGWESEDKVVQTVKQWDGSENEEV